MPTVVAKRAPGSLAERGPRKGEKKPPRQPRPYDPNRLTLTKAETANELGISIRAVDKLITSGELKARQIFSRRTIRIMRSDLLAFLENNAIN